MFVLIKFIRISSELIVYIILSCIPGEKHQQLANKESKHTKITWASPWKIHMINKIDASKENTVLRTHRNPVWAASLKPLGNKTPWEKLPKEKKSTLMSDSRRAKIPLPPEKQSPDPFIWEYGCQSGRPVEFRANPSRVAG